MSTKNFTLVVSGILILSVGVLTGGLVYLGAKMPVMKTTAPGQQAVKPVQISEEQRRRELLEKYSETNGATTTIGRDEEQRRRELLEKYDETIKGSTTEADLKAEEQRRRELLEKYGE